MDANGRELNSLICVHSCPFAVLILPLLPGHAPAPKGLERIQPYLAEAAACFNQDDIAIICEMIIHAQKAKA